jgi:DNA-binding NtrC family response regulator
MSRAYPKPADPSVGCSFGISGVFLTCLRDDFDFFSILLRYADIRLFRAETVEQADFLLTVTGSTVLLCDPVFLDGSWQNALDMVAYLHPKVASVVIAEAVDEPFVSGAPERGVCAILWKPFQVAQFRRIIETAHDAAIERAAEKALTAVVQPIAG